MHTTTVNDTHSSLNATEVARIVLVDSLEAIGEALTSARRAGAEVAIAGGFHAMGGQQFRTGGVLLDMRPMHDVISFDRERGVVEVEAGVQWPDLMRHLEGEQGADPSAWGIVQKQSGADRLSIAGSISANAHGRGLDLRPMVADVDSFVLVGPDGAARRCSRTENAGLFSLAIGGYGLFGVIASVALRLRERQKVQRVVEVITVEEVMADSSRASPTAISTATSSSPQTMPRRISYVAASSRATGRSTRRRRSPLGSARSPPSTGHSCCSSLTSTRRPPTMPTSSTTWRPTARSTSPTPTRWPSTPTATTRRLSGRWARSTRPAR